ncbi:MAG TPA: META domain-containing protein [Burkholderiales bacterium]|jgi:heat shock protein HslJ/uncharacterized protein YecT (DUF1311 family)|nr:META domain-containing protein [Burkholderiales bacterium]
MNIRSISRSAVLIALFGGGAAAAQTPLEECTQGAVERSALIACLDAKLRDATLKLNAALRAAQQRIEQLERDNRRAGMSNFIDSQRRFNAYRDSNCTWQAVQAPPGSRGEEFVKDCQIRATLAREQELAAFVQRANAAPALPATSSSAPPPAADAPQTQVALPAVTVVEEQGASVIVAPAEPLTAISPAATASSAPSPSSAETVLPAASERPIVQWRLAQWKERGRSRALLPGSSITVSFDPSGKVTGNASVNRFNGQYRFNLDGELEWSATGFVATRMAGSPALMRQEQAFLAALRRTRHYRGEGNRLVLRSTDGAVELTFVR